ncbi:hypothetical protein [Candidatus Nitrospira bockiana]
MTMLKSMRKADSTAWVIVGLVAGVFLIDWLTPLGVVVWVLYLVPIALVARKRTPKEMVMWTSVCSVLIVLGLFVSPSGVPVHVGVINRVLGVTSLWTVTFLLRLWM